MTGEVFALLRAHGILAGMLDGAVTDGAAFRRGLRRGIASQNLAATLFEVRAGVLLERLAPSEAAAYASGILIGADVATREDLGRRPVHVLGGGALGALYAVAITEAGGTPVVVPDGSDHGGDPRHLELPRMTILDRFDAAFSACPLVAILRGLTPEEAPEVGDALVEAGFTPDRGSAQLAGAAAQHRRSWPTDWPGVP